MEKIQNVGYEYLIASEISLVSELVQQGTGSQLQLGSKLHGINVYRTSFVAFASMMFNFSHSFHNSRFKICTTPSYRLFKKHSSVLSSDSGLEAEN